MKQRILIGVLSLVLVMAAGATVMAAETIGIGLCAPLSGGAASWGKKA